MTRVLFLWAQVLLATAMIASPALAQATEAPQPAWKIVTYVLLGLVLLAVLVWTGMAINRRRQPGETPVEGGPPVEESDATPGPSRYDDEGPGTPR